MATMSRQHFQLIADVLADISLGLDDKDFEWVVDKFADELEETNERFDRPKFVRACNVAYTYQEPNGREKVDSDRL